MPKRTPIVTLLASTVLDDDPTSINSAPVDVTAYREALVYLTMDSTLTPTTIQWIAQFSDDGGVTWYDYLEGIWAAMFFEDTVMASQITQCYRLPLVGRRLRLRAVAVGTDATNFFTISAKIEARD